MLGYGGGGSGRGRESPRNKITEEQVPWGREGSRPGPNRRGRLRSVFPCLARHFLQEPRGWLRGETGT